jgi:hypothetical protein
LTRISFLSSCKIFWGISIKKNWRSCFRLRCKEFKK